MNHVGEKAFNCDVCGKVIPSVDSRRNHKQICAERSSEIARNRKRPERTIEHKCTVCPKQFATYNELLEHLQSHPISELKPFQCKICNKRAATKGHLKMHMLTHGGEQPYECDVCGTGYSSKSLLLSHKIIHSISIRNDFDAINECFNKT